MSLRLPLRGWAWCVAFFAWAASPGRAAEGEPFRLVIGLRAHEGAERRWAQAHVYRELVRQSLVLAAVQEAGWRPHDATFDGYGTAPGDAPRVEVATFHAGSVFRFEASWGDGKGEPWKGEFPLPGRRDEDVVEIARRLATEIPGGAAAWLRARLGEGAWRPAEAGLASPGEGVAGGGALDPVSVFERLRRGHAAAAREPGPIRFADLARDYAVLGETVRGWWSPLPSAMTARALLLAERAAALAPDDDAVRASRAWAYGVAGYHAVALRDLDALRDREAGPGWAGALDDALHHRTEELVRRAEAGGGDSELAALLAVTQAGFLGAPNYTGRILSRLEGRLPHNPRPFFTAAREFGVGGLHRSTAGALEGAWRTLTERVPTVGALPAELRRLATLPPPAKPRGAGLASLVWGWFAGAAPEAPADSREAAESRDPELHRRFAIAAEEAARSDAGYPAWDALGRLLWDEHFVAATARLHFMAVSWSVETRREVAAWGPGFVGHPLAEALATYGRGHESGDRDGGFERVRLGVVTPGMWAYVNRWARRPAGAARFADREVGRAVDEVYWWSDNDAVSAMWHLDAASGDAVVRDARKLLEASPHNPAGFAALIRAGGDWREALARARELGIGHPLIAWAEGDRLRRERRWEESAARLREAAEALGEKRVFEQLAESYLQAGSEDLWLQTRLGFERFEDQGLGHARNRQEIARHFLGKRRPLEALPHAERAARSYAEWALQTYALNLWIAGRDDEALRIVDAIGERYGDRLGGGLVWHAIAGHGSEAGLRALLAEESRASRRAVFHDLFGEQEAALRAYADAYREESDNYYLLMAGLLRLERGERAEARATFARVGAEYGGNRTRNWMRSFNRDLAEVFVRQIDGFDLAKLEEEVARARGAWVRDEVHRLNAEYQGDIAFFLARFALAHGATERGREWMRGAAAPGVVRYITPLLARRLESWGESYRALFLPEGGTAGEASNPTSGAIQDGV